MRGCKIFEGIIFTVRAKSAKILLLENLSLYGIFVLLQILLTFGTVTSSLVINLFNGK